MNKETIKIFRKELLDNLTQNILPYWIDRMTDPRGGFYGRRDGNDHLDEEAPKGAILNARILWSFSAAYLATGNPDYLAAATRALDYIVGRFIDPDFGGAYWSLNADARRSTPRSSSTRLPSSSTVLLNTIVHVATKSRCVSPLSCSTLSSFTRATVCATATSRLRPATGSRLPTCA